MALKTRKVAEFLILAILHDDTGANFIGLRESNSLRGMLTDMPETVLT